MMKYLGILGLVTMLAMLVGCKSTPKAGLSEDRVEQTRQAITKSVSDPAKSAKMLKVIDRFDLAMNDNVKNIRQIREEIVKLNMDYTVERSVLEQKYALLEDQVRVVGHTLRDHSLELRSLCSADQWDAIADSDGAVVDFVF